MFKVLILQASHSLSDERTEYLIKDRLSFMRFLGLTLADRVPDANSIWNFREALTRTIVDGKPAIEVLFKRFDAALAKAGFLAMGGQIIDATIVAAPKQRNTEAEKKAIKEGLFPPIDADFLMAAIVGVAFEVGERMILRDKRDPLAAANFATALFLGGIRTLPHAEHPAAKTGTA